MAVVITPTPNVAGLFVDVAVTGLTPGTVYDVLRLQVRSNGEDDLGVPVYEDEQPGRRALWSSVAHRVEWSSAVATASFRDYEVRLRPFRYFIVDSTLTPRLWDYDAGEYDIAQGALSPVVHLNRLMTDQTPGLLLIRSTVELGLYAAECVYDLDEIRYTARGQELAVIGRQYPVPIMDTREARRGSLTLLTKSLGAYHDLRRIVFPASGRIKPVVVHSGGDPTMLLDDMTLVPMDVTVEQASQRNPNQRWIRLDYVEVDPMDPFVERPGDVDDTPLPVANFTISSPRKVGEKITFTDSSTAGSAPLSVWDWTFSPAASTETGKRTKQGPYKVSYGSIGEKRVKLRVGDTTGAFGVIERSFTVVK